MNKTTLVIGFMLFAIFFGAGNLIFPPKLGLESGADFLPAISGFVITGIGLPMLGIITAGFYQGGYKEALKRIHPLFSLLFLAAVYLTIGPFFAIPRTGATAYSMAVVPFLGESGTLSLLLFTLIYYLAVLWFSFNPSKTVELIGKILTPLLLVAIVALVVKAAFLLSGQAPVFVAENANSASFFNGMLEGYHTMDALASIAFSVIVINAVKSKGAVDGKEFIQQIISAGVIAAAALALIYIALGWIGNKMPISAEQAVELSEKGLNIGTYILNTIATDTFGLWGRTLLGVIVTLACFTTSVGLVVAASEYFHEIFPTITYKTYVLIFTLISFVIANQGLDVVISKSVPVLLLLYPIAMSVILVLLIKTFLPLGNNALRWSLSLVTLISFCSAFGLNFTQALPLKAQSMEWLPFLVVGLLIGIATDKITIKTKEQ